MSAPDSGTMLQPGQLIRPPAATEANARELLADLYGMTVTWVKELVSYDDRNYWVKVEEKYNNPNVDKLWPHGYILKILNSMDSHKIHVDAEHEMQKLLHSQGVHCPQPVLNLNGEEKNLTKITYGGKNTDNNNELETKKLLYGRDSSVRGDGGGRGCEVRADSTYTIPEHKTCKNCWHSKEEGASGMHIVRLLTFIPGEILHSVPYTPRLMHNVGNTLGKITNALKGYSHEVLKKHESVWNLRNLLQLRGFVYAVKDPSDKAMIEDILEAFSKEVLPNLHKCTPAVIHGDYNEQNILVQELPGQENIPKEQREYENHGVIDFGDASDSYVLFDISITAMYMMVESKIVDPLLVSGHVLAGFYDEYELNATEKDLLKLCMCGRFCQSLVMGAYTNMQDPGNDYVLITAKRGWKILRDFWSTPKETVYKNWEEIIESYRK